MHYISLLTTIVLLGSADLSYAFLQQSVCNLDKADACRSSELDSGSNFVPPSPIPGVVNQKQSTPYKLHTSAANHSSVRSDRQETLYLTNGEWAPYTSENLHQYGIASQIVTEAFAQANIRVEYGFYPWKRALKYARKGRGDRLPWHGSIMWIYSTERKRHFLYSDVVLKDKRQLFFTNSNVMDSLQSPKLITIGLVDGTIYPLLERTGSQHRFTSQLRLEKAGGYPTLFKRLQMNRVDAVYVEKWVGKYYLQTIYDPVFQQQIKSTDLISELCRFHVVFNKHHVKNRFYRQQFNKGLARLKQTGRYQAIFDESAVRKVIDAAEDERFNKQWSHVWKDDKR